MAKSAALSLLYLVVHIGSSTAKNQLEHAATLPHASFTSYSEHALPAVTISSSQKLNTINARTLQKHCNQKRLNNNVTRTADDRVLAFLRSLLRLVLLQSKNVSSFNLRRPCLDLANAQTTNRLHSIPHQRLITRKNDVVGFKCECG
jgi:hypothetical protein